MVHFLFERTHYVEKTLFSPSLYELFPYANEYFRLWLDNTPESDKWDTFVRRLQFGQDLKGPYSDLNDKEKKRACDLVHTFLNFVPSYLNSEGVKGMLGEKNNETRAIALRITALTSFVDAKRKHKAADELQFNPGQTKTFLEYTATGHNLIPKKLADHMKIIPSRL